MAQEELERCILACNRCAAACDHCSTACLGEDNVAHMTRCIRLDMDCSAMCRLAASAMARNSESAGKICRLCAEVCQTCSDECGKHQYDHCKDCAEACMECADACLKMAA